jgi:hypothetical protein
MLQNHLFEVQKWTLYCDNQALVERLQLTQGENETPLKWIDSDIIESIQQKILPNGEFKHVKGHQKIDNKNRQKLEVILNNWVDDMANKAITSDKTMTSPENIAHVVVNGKRLFKQSQIIRQCAKHISQQYHKSKYGSVNYHHIDWEVYKKNHIKISEINVDSKNDTFIDTNK